MAAYYIKVAGGEENFENEWNPLEFSSLAYYDWPIEPVVSKSEEIDLEKKKKKKGRKNAKSSGPPETATQSLGERVAASKTVRVSRTNAKASGSDIATEGLVSEMAILID